MINRISSWLKSSKGNLYTSIEVDTEHVMVALCRTLDWEELVGIYFQYRSGKIKNGAGRTPNVRILLGMLLVRILKSCTLREAQDLARHYGPARVLCNLQQSNWNPNFRTLSDFELMLGEGGLQEINAYVLRKAQQLGFADIRGLCADTTVQEAKIPYPNEVGLMDSSLRSIRSGIEVLKGFFGKAGKPILKQISEARTLVREHRLFAKTIDAKRIIAKQLHQGTQTILATVSSLIHSTSGKIQSLKKHQKTALRRLTRIQQVFQQLSPQIDYFLNTGKVAKNKIISMFHPDLRSITRNKAGKKSEFGIRWGINRIRGGYLLLFTRFQLRGQGEGHFMVQAVQEHIKIFGEAPAEFGYDRGGWSEPHMKQIKNLGVKRVAVAPKGQAEWKVSQSCKERMTCERSQVEGVIGTIKSYGFNKPHVKTTPALFLAGHRAGLRFNLTKFVRDLNCSQVQAAAG